MRAVARFMISLLLIPVMLFIIFANYRIYYKPNTVNQLNHLKYLTDQFNEGAASEMQLIYPEGYIFFNTLYGLAWADFAGKPDRNSSLNKEAVQAVELAFGAINGESGKSTFDENLTLPYGAFYNGWSMYVLAAKLRLERAEERDSLDIVLFKTMCDQMAMALSACPFLESYQNAAWPADAMMCVAALAEHDRLFNPTYQNVIDGWTTSLKMNLDENGLIPHEVHPCSGKIRQSARGSSQSLMLAILPKFDSVFSKQQFSIYKDRFIDTRFGLCGVLEYPKGTNGDPDIDSGPLIFGMGGAATIVGIRAAIMNDDPALASQLGAVVETFGLSRTRGAKKNYLLGQLPIADAFIAWTNPDTPMKHAEKNWRWTFHLYSTAFLLLAFLVLFASFRLTKK